MQAVSDFDESALLHHGHSIAQIAHQWHGVRDEEISQAQRALQVAEQVDDLGANRDIESADRLIQDEEGRAQCKSAGNINALALPARELVWIAWQRRFVEPDGGQERAEAYRQAFRRWFMMDGERLGKNLANGSCAG